MFHRRQGPEAREARTDRPFDPLKHSQPGTGPGVTRPRLEALSTAVQGRNGRRSSSGATRVELSVVGGSPEFEQALLELFAKHQPELALYAIDRDREWTRERVASLLRIVSANGRLLIIELVRGEGYVALETLQAVVRNAQAPARAVTIALGRGVREGLWPAQIPVPMRAAYADSDGPCPSIIGYTMPLEFLPVFTDAARPG